MDNKINNKHAAERGENPDERLNCVWSPIEVKQACLLDPMDSWLASQINRCPPLSSFGRGPSDLHLRLRLLLHNKNNSTCITLDSFVFKIANAAQTRSSWMDFHLASKWIQQNANQSNSLDWRPQVRSKTQVGRLHYLLLQQVAIDAHWLEFRPFWWLTCPANKLSQVG